MRFDVCCGRHDGRTVLPPSDVWVWVTGRRASQGNRIVLGNPRIFRMFVDPRNLATVAFTCRRKKKQCFEKEIPARTDAACDTQNWVKINSRRYFTLLLCLVPRYPVNLLRLVFGRGTGRTLLLSLGRTWDGWTWNESKLQLHIISRGSWRCAYAIPWQSQSSTRSPLILQASDSILVIKA